MGYVGGGGTEMALFKGTDPVEHWYVDHRCSESQNGMPTDDPTANCGCFWHPCGV